MKEKLLKIINYYGIEKQLKYIHSEYFELDEAILTYETNKGYMPELSQIKAKNHIVEEIADVFVMLNQFKEYYKIDEKEIITIMQSKIDRQLERIENENN